MANWLGIDISSSAVRVALLEARYRGVELVGLREERLADHSTLSLAVAAAVGPFRADGCAAALDGRRCFVRTLELPNAAAKDLASVLSFEVEASLPVELDDAVMDHRRLTPSKEQSGAPTFPLLAGVAYTAEVADRIALIRRAIGMEPNRVGVGGLSLVNLSQVVPGLKRQTSAILDLDEEHCDLLILRDGEPCFLRSLSRGVAGLPEEASGLARELRQSLSAWRASGGEPIVAMRLVGPGRATPGISAFLEKELEVHVVELGESSIVCQDPALKQQIPRFGLAVSLALGLSRQGSDLDLRQGPLAVQQSYQFLREKTPLLAGLMTAIVVSASFSVYAQQRHVDSERAVLLSQLSASTKAHFGTAAKTLKGAERLMAKAISGKTLDPVPEVDAFDVIVELSKRIPVSVTHDVAEFDYKRGTVSVKGVVGSIEDAQVIEDAMKKHPCFTDVKPGRTTKLKRDNKQKYTLSFRVDCNAKGTSGSKKKDKSKKGRKP